jgi:hypothetical protein
MGQVLGHCTAEENARRRNTVHAAPETLFNMGNGKIGAGRFFEPLSAALKTQTPADPEDRDRRFVVRVSRRIQAALNVILTARCAAAPAAYRSASALIDRSAGFSLMLSR